MKTTIASLLAAFAAVLPTTGMAASDHGSHGALPTQASTPAPTKMVDGLVKKIDKAAGKITLSHGPLVNLGMDMPMTMVFRVKDAAWLDRLKEGDKIRFMADKINGTFTIVALEAGN